MSRAIDHLVLAVRDLDAARDFYERLGCQVGARNRHPWGTENRLVQFAGSFLELITIERGAPTEPHGARRFSFGRFIADRLTERQGFAMLALRSDDAKADAATFAAADIGDFEPFGFERRGRRPDGSETMVAFTLAFAEDALAATAGFFVCQHHFPENFWNPAFQRHPNGATDVTGIAMVAENPTDHHIFLSAFTGERELAATSSGISVYVPNGRIDVLTPQAAAAHYGVSETTNGGAGLIAFTMAVPELSVLRRLLADREVPHRMIGGRAVVPPETAFGVAVSFEHKTA